MNLQFYLEKLRNSDEFKQFIKKNPDAFLCSGFFSIDKEGRDNKQHFDFSLLGKNKIFSFQLEENCKKVSLENLNKTVLNKLNEEFDFNFEEIERIIYDKIIQEGIRNKIQKILLSLQKIGKNNFLIGTVFISSFGLIKININLDEKKVTDFEKKSFFDMINILRKKK